MYKFIFIFFICYVFSIPVQANIDIYVSMEGDPGAKGDILSPTTLQSAIKNVTAGGTIYLREGVYEFAKTLRIGRSNNGVVGYMKNIFSYPGEQVILDFSKQSEDSANRGLKLAGSYWHIKGIIVQGAGDDGVYVAGHHNIIERLTARFNRGTGIRIGRLSSKDTRTMWPSYNQVLSCVSHDNRDRSGENADGFAANLRIGAGNVFRYNVAHHNSDDGWDLYTKKVSGPIPPVVIEDSIAYSNGLSSDGVHLIDGDGNGFKLGGDNLSVNHIVRRNLAFKNRSHGFTYNRNLGRIEITDNTAVNNGGVNRLSADGVKIKAARNFSFNGGASIFKGNTSCQGHEAIKDRIIGSQEQGNDWWMGDNSEKCKLMLGLLPSQGVELVWGFDAGGRLHYELQTDVGIP